MSVLKKLKDCVPGDIISLSGGRYPLLLSRVNTDLSEGLSFILLYLSKDTDGDNKKIKQEQFGPMLYNSVGRTSEELRDSEVTVLGNIAQELYEIEQECIQHANK